MVIVLSPVAIVLIGFVYKTVALQSVPSNSIKVESVLKLLAALKVTELIFPEQDGENVCPHDVRSKET